MHLSRRCAAGVLALRRRVGDIPDLHRALRVTMDGGGQATHLVRMTGHSMRDDDLVLLLTGITVYGSEVLSLAGVIHGTYTAKRIGIEEITVMESGYRLGVEEVGMWGDMGVCETEGELREMQVREGRGGVGWGREWEV